MARFDYNRAAMFGEYTVSALVRDEGEKEVTFVRIARKDLMKALGTSKLHPEHITAVKDSVVRQGVCMADMTTHFLFFHDDLADMTKIVFGDDLVSITDHFERLSTEAANESWDDKSYLPEPKKGRSKKKVVADAVKAKSSTIRLRG